MRSKRVEYSALIVLRLILALAAITLICLALLVHAEAPEAQTQLPGYYRLMLGQSEITALYDGAIELDTKLLHNTTTRFFF